MKQINQKDYNGCGIAATAMITGKSYQTVKNIWLSYGNKKKKLQRLKSKVVTSLGRGINYFELKILIDRIAKKDNSRPHLVVCEIQPFVLKVRNKDGTLHWVAVTPNGKIYSPNFCPKII